MLEGSYNREWELNSFRGGASPIGGEIDQGEIPLHKSFKILKVMATLGQE